MKLVACKRCMQVVSLRTTETRCPCGDSGGRYLPDGDDNQAEYWGEAVPLMFSSREFGRAVRNGGAFAAAVVTSDSRTFTRRP